MSWKWSKQRRVATVRAKSFKCLSTSMGKRLPWNWTNFISTRVWTELGRPKLQQAHWRYHSASKHPLPIIGTFTAEAKYGDVSKSYPVSFLVSEIPDLNLLGRDTIRAMRISLDDPLFSEATDRKSVV